ncbi:MAG: hypothetical protein R2712_10105 [Vicinamibacterales bacterium]
MNAHERQQFDWLLQTAVDQFAERLVQRNAGAESALERLTATPEAEGVWLSAFVDAVFRDGLLDNPSGAAFVLQALERRAAPVVTSAATIGELLNTAARSAFAVLLRQKTLEELERRSRYQAQSTESL